MLQIFYIHEKFKYLYIPHWILIMFFLRFQNKTMWLEMQSHEHLIFILALVVFEYVA